MPHTQQFPDMTVCVLAAGKGKRMRSTQPKVLHPVLGKAMLLHVLHTVEELNPRGIAVVTGEGSEQVRAHVGEPANLEWVLQAEQLGTGHAVRQCEAACGNARQVMIVCGDTPLLRSEALAELAGSHLRSGAAVSFLSAEMDNPHGYGRVVRNDAGEVVAIVEEKDASDEHRRISEVSSGIYCVDRDALFGLLAKVGNANAQGEYYLPDIVPLAIAEGLKVNAVELADASQIQGVNNRVQLALTERIMQQRIIEDWQMNGVTVEQPETVRIEASVRIGVDTVIRAGSQLLGATTIGDECEIGPYAVLGDAWLDDGCRIFAFSHVQAASIGEGCLVGPFARLRPEAKLDEEVHIGNFVEVKKAVVGRGSKINHLSYVGDAFVGSNCNIGAGTITCNYDGANKHVTDIGDNVFVGSDTKLIAPIRVADDATIGAGSILTRDVAAGGLTLSARPDQRHVAGWKRPTKRQR